MTGPTAARMAVFTSLRTVSGWSEGLRSTESSSMERERAPGASAVPKVRGNGRCEDVIFFDGVFFEPSLKSIFFVS